MAVRSRRAWKESLLERESPREAKSEFRQTSAMVTNATIRLGRGNCVYDRCADGKLSSGSAMLSNLLTQRADDPAQIGKGSRPAPPVSRPPAPSCRKAGTVLW